MNEELREALSGQTLAHYDEELDVLVTWNGSSVFNVYESNGELLDTFTQYGANTNAGVCTPAEALVAIGTHLMDMSAERNPKSFGVES